MKQLVNISDIKSFYPNEWILLENPIMDESKIEVLEGIPLFHSKGKKKFATVDVTKLQTSIK